MKNLTILPIILCATLLVSCAKTPDEAREALKKKGVAYNSYRFVEAAAHGDRELVELFLQAGMKVDTTDDGITPLMAASFCGNNTLVKLLLKHGADVDIESRDGVTALNWAASKGHVTTVKLLIRNGATVNARNRYGWTSMKIAKEKGYDTVVGALADAGGHD